MPTFNITTLGTTSPTTLTAASSILCISGTFDGDVIVNTGPSGAPLVPLTIWPGTKIGPRAAFDCRIPSGYQVSVTTANGSVLPNLRVDID